MADKKWKSVMVLATSHDKIKDLATLHKLPLNQMLEHLVERAWIAAFDPQAKPAIQVPTTFRSKA
jgi:hypothetical protein